MWTHKFVLWTELYYLRLKRKVVVWQRDFANRGDGRNWFHVGPFYVSFTRFFWHGPWHSSSFRYRDGTPFFTCINLWLVWITFRRPLGG